MSTEHHCQEVLTLAEASGGLERTAQKEACNGMEIWDRRPLLQMVSKARPDSLHKTGAKVRPTRSAHGCSPKFPCPTWGHLCLDAYQHWNHDTGTRPSTSLRCCHRLMGRRPPGQLFQERHSHLSGCWVVEPHGAHEEHRGHLAVEARGLHALSRVACSRKCSGLCVWILHNYATCSSYCTGTAPCFVGSPP